MKLRMCNCHHCRRGRKNRTTRKAIRNMRKDYRSRVRRLLRSGEMYDLPTAIPVPYTD